MEKILRDKLPTGRFRNVKLRTSKTMMAIANKHNRSTERKFRMALVRAGLRGWILHAQGIFGCPDIYFPRQKVAVFLDGCFWHGCPKCGHIPKTNRAFWRTKIARNQKRDKQANNQLRVKGTSVIRIWEHSLRDTKDLAACIAILDKRLRTRSK